ncbi:MAG: TSUP family transporter, partial [Nocardioides sp.]|nr:TSUP family transporter [Nocardioides sp.]
LLACFAALMLVVAGVMMARLLGRGDGDASGRAALDDPIITFSPTFACQCPRALKVLVAATVVGLLTGFLGVGGGFLVVPALLVALALPMEYAAGTSLVVIAMTSAVALAVRAGTGVSPDWWLVLLLTAASGAGAVGGARLAARTDTRRLQVAFTVLVLVVAVYTAARAFPALS